MTDETGIGTANTMRERLGESRIKLWMLLRADRLVVSSILTGAVFVAFVIAVAVLHPPLARQIESGDMIDTMFSTMITVIVTGTTLVVTIGQLVLSQENGPLGDQRERMSNSMDFRDFTEELIGSPSPVEPSEFLQQIVGVTAERTTALREATGENDDESLRKEVDAFAESVRETLTRYVTNSRTRSSARSMCYSPH
ncbi:MAG: hypothetical protein ACI8TL_001767 [Natronomonas sp.]|jgi:hypothetical protein